MKTRSASAGISAGSSVNGNGRITRSTWCPAARRAASGSVNCGCTTTACRGRSARASSTKASAAPAVSSTSSVARRCRAATAATAGRWSGYAARSASRVRAASQVGVPDDRTLTARSTRPGTRSASPWWARPAFSRACIHSTLSRHRYGRFCGGLPADGRLAAGLAGPLGRILVAALEAGRPFFLDVAVAPDDHGGGPGEDEHADDDEAGLVDVEVVHEAPEAAGSAQAADLLREQAQRLHPADEEADGDRQAGDREVVVHLADRV